MTGRVDFTGAGTSDNASTQHSSSVLTPKAQAKLLESYTPFFTALFPSGKFALTETMLLSYPTGKSPCFDSAAARTVLALLPKPQQH